MFWRLTHNLIPENTKIIGKQILSLFQFLDQHARPITLLTTTILFPRGNLRRGSRIARRDIEGRVAIEEVPRTQEQRHRLSRHDGVVFRRREMRETECVPQDNIGVVDGTAWTRGLNPGWKTLRGLAGGLGDVVTGWVDFFVGV